MALRNIDAPGDTSKEYLGKVSKLACSVMYCCVTVITGSKLLAPYPSVIHQVDKYN